MCSKSLANAESCVVLELVSLIGTSIRNYRTQTFLHGGEDLVSALDPDERLRVLVPGPGPLSDPSVEFGHVAL